METVEIPLQIAQKAMRHFRPLVPYVRKRIAELRNEKKKIEDVSTEQPEEVKTKSKKVK